MRIVILIAFIFCFVGASAQSYDSTKLYRSLDYGWQYKRLKVDSILHLPNGVIINRAWKFPVTDTASLSYRINQKLNLSDTSYMLSWYMKKTDTVSLSNRINLRVKYSDTAAMLLPYLRKLDTASLSNRIDARVKYTDTAAMLLPYMRDEDTVSLSNRINKKQDSIILTTTGSGGASTLIGSTLNVPNYSGALTGYVPYVGATTNVNLGLKSLNGAVVTVDSSFQIKNREQAWGNSLSDYTAITADRGAFNFFTEWQQGQQLYKNGAQFVYPQISGMVTVTKQYRLPVRNGTIALVEDTVNLSARIDTKLGYTDTVSLSNRINLKADKSTTLTINGTGYDLSANRSWTIPTTDTASLSARINAESSRATTAEGLKLNIPDTAAMLANYQTAINNKLNISDTAAMLSPYYKASNPAGYITSASIAGKLNISDTAAMLTGYQTVINQKLKGTDTVSLSNRINLKADKATTLTINGTGYDLSANRSWTIAGTDTASLSNRINTKLNSADTASLSNRINTKADILSGTTNTVPKFTSSTTIGNSNIKDNGNAVTVNATAGVYGALQVGSYNGNILMNTSNISAGLIFQNTSASNKLWDFSSFDNDINFSESGVAPPVMTLKSGGNIGINTTSPSNKLEVNGTFKSVGVATFGSTLSNGTYSYTLPSATGTLALTSQLTSGTVTSIATGLGLSGGTITTSGTLLVDTSSASILSRQRAANTYATTSALSGYLPLSGGTLTGALGGTSATFSGLFEVTNSYADFTRAGKLLRLNPNYGNLNTYAQLEVSSGMDLSFAVGGSEKLRLFNDGNVLIQSGGTFSNAGYKLDVNGTVRFTSNLLAQKVQVGTAATINDATGVGNTLQFANYSAGVFVTGSADSYIYKTSGAFGGLSAQTLIFQTRSDVGGGGFAFVGGSTPSAVATISSTGAASFSSRVNVNGATDDGSTALNVTGSGKFSGAVTSNELILSNAGGTYASWYVGAYLIGRIGNVSSNDMYYDATFGGNHYFRTGTGGTTSPSTKFTILQSGNVGIGTTAPELKMTIYGEGAAFPATSGTSQTGALRLEQDGSNICTDFGSNNALGAWLQVTNKANLAGIFPLLINPNGGNLLIGTTTDNGAKLQVAGNLSLTTAGNKLLITTGTNASAGTTAAMTAGTITVTTTAALTGSIIQLTAQTTGGTAGALRVSARVNATSFTITSSSALDTSTVGWVIIN